MTMDVTTDELWTMAVRRAPITTNRIRLWMLARNDLTSSISANPAMASLIMFKPTKSSPNPAMMPPIFLVLSFFA